MEFQQTLTTLLLSSTLLHSQNFLEPLIVTASRSELNLSNLPYSISELHAQDFADRKIRTLPDSLIYIPGVVVQKTSYGHGSPFIRGFTGRQNLLMVDGVRLNNSTWRSGPVQYWNTVDPFSISSYELVKSQGSVLYGSDAIGGTLNAFTKSSNFRSQPPDQSFFHGSSYYEHRTNGQGSHIGRIESSFGIGGKYGIHLGLSSKDFGDIKDSAVGRMNGTGHPEEDLDLRIDYALSQDITLTLAHQYVNQDGVSRWHRTVNNPGWIHDDHIIAPGTFLANDYDQERSLTYIRVAGDNPQNSSFIQKWSATLSFQDSTDSELQVRTATNSRRNNIDTQTYGFDLTLESKIGPGNLVYGLDYYLDNINSSAQRAGASGIFTDRPDDRPVADNSSYHLFGAYTQYDWDITDTFKLLTGIRYTHATAEWDNYRAPGTPADVGGNEDWDNLSASIRALYDINTNWQIFAGLSQAFRAPNLSDLTGNQLSLFNTTSLGSNVDPEEFLTAELGTRYGTDNFTFALSTFYTWTDGAITAVANPLDPTQRIATNGQDGFIYGIETEAAWNISDQWTLRGTLAWQEGKSETATNGERWLTRLLPLTATSTLRWTHPEQTYWIEAGLIGAMQEDRLHPADQAADNQRLPTNGTPGYLIATMRAAWQVNPNFQLSTSLENILDDDYRYIGSGQNEPGLNLIIGAKATW
jgi:hemoglobin/transferrin/lactoferrin receptor protein